MCLATWIQTPPFVHCTSCYIGTNSFLCPQCVLLHSYKSFLYSQCVLLNGYKIFPMCTIFCHMDINAFLCPHSLATWRQNLPSVHDVSPHVYNILSISTMSCHMDVYKLLPVCTSCHMDVYKILLVCTMSCLSLIHISEPTRRA